MISFIVAMDNNRLIGVNNDLPWHIPNDLQFFKEKTIGNTIIMGRKTFESLGRVLPKRHHIVVTKSQDREFPKEVEVFSNLDEVIELSKKTEDEIFVIGGGRVFSELLPHADRLYITQIDAVFSGDIYFPNFSMKDWKITSKIKGKKDNKNPYDYYFCQYDRIS